MLDKEHISPEVKADADTLVAAVSRIYNEIGRQVAELYPEPEWRDGRLAFYGEMNDREGDDSRSVVSDVIDASGAGIRWLRPVHPDEQYSFLVYTESLDRLATTINKK